MPGNILGERFVTMSFGESHGKCVGMVVDGCPAGLPLDASDIQSAARSAEDQAHLPSRVRGKKRTRLRSYLEFIMDLRLVHRFVC